MGKKLRGGVSSWNEGEMAKERKGETFSNKCRRGGPRDWGSTAEARMQRVAGSGGSMSRLHRTRW